MIAASPGFAGYPARYESFWPPRGISGHNYAGRLWISHVLLSYYYNAVIDIPLNSQPAVPTTILSGLDDL